MYGPLVKCRRLTLDPCARYFPLFRVLLRKTVESHSMRHHCIQCSILETWYKFRGGQRRESVRERRRKGIGEEGGLPSPSLRRRAKFPTRCKTKFTKFAQRLAASLSLSPCTSSRGEEWAELFQVKLVGAEFIMRRGGSA